MKYQIDQIIEDWIFWLAQVRSLAKNTAEAYKLDILNLLKFLKDYRAKNILLRDLKDVDKTDLRAWLCARKLHNISAKSNARALSALKSFFLYLKRNFDIVNQDVFDFKVKAEAQKIPKHLLFMQIEEVFAIIQKTATKKWIAKRNIALLCLLYGCGLRISEALDLCVGDVQSQTIKICGKGNKERMVYILPSVLHNINEYINLCPYLHDAKCNLFVNQKGKALCRTTVASYLVFLRKKFNLASNLTPHAFRHSFATHFLQNGLGIRQIQELLGHKSLTSTEIYTKTDPQSLVQSYKKFWN